MPSRRGLRRVEARRYAHLVAERAIAAYLAADRDWRHGTDGVAIERELYAIAEQHSRFGPKSGDRPPSGTVRTGTPLLDTLGGEVADDGQHVQ